MNKKTGLQVMMVLFSILISLWFYLKYFTENFEDVRETRVIEKIDENQNSTSTYINDINYVSTDIRGNEYQITAKQAEIKIENSDLMFLTDVIAFVFIKDKDTVKITSNFGKYNSKNYDTIFSENVIVIYPGHKITGEYLDFSFLTNLGIFTTNVIYTGEKTNLFADGIEMNLATKDTKIFMDQPTVLYDDFSELNKVLVEGTE
ncbi:LPS export ABC transporter periplasmic protein LptC [Candidatus Pelagibacter sp.]|nr:LPS export ABC transporter periplasmic protein LptC [Candidatus Pelagibacter sp.]